MRRGMRRTSLLLAGLGAAFLAGCSGDSTGPGLPSSLSIDVKEQFVLTGDTLRIAITTDGGDASSVEWQSLNPQVATVQDGVVTGVARGNARIVARAGSLADTATIGVLRSTFNVNADNFCSNPQWAPVRIAAVGARSIILADTRNPAGALSDAEYQNLAFQFDNAVYPTVTGAFGEPMDVDGNKRFIVLFSRAVNELTSDPSQGFISGFVWARDLFPRTAGIVMGLSFPDDCPGSNEAEMTYLAIPDPSWPENIRNFIRRTIVSTMAHEFQHAINASRRIFVFNALPEEVWLNEAMSHIVEELMFYRMSGLGPGQAIDLQTLTSTQQRVDAVNAFQISNLANFGTYLRGPESDSPLAPSGQVRGPTRGSAWNLLRYAADRRGGDQNQLWYSLLNTELAGTANLQQTIGSDLLPWMRDWSVSLYASRGSPHADSRFRQASWNFASVLPALFDEFPLSLQPLENEVARSTTIRAGSAAYMRFAVASGEVAEIDVRVTGETQAESCRDTGATTSLGVGEVYTAPVGTAQSLCFAGGGSGAEFALIPFHASLTPGANLIVDVVGNGIQTILAAPVASRTGGAHPFRLDHSSLVERSASVSHGEALHLRMLDREREEVARRLRRHEPALFSGELQSTADGPLMVSVVRIL
jgi:hypothetical protein